MGAQKRAHGARHSDPGADHAASKYAVCDQLAGFPTLQQGVVDESSQSQLPALPQRRTRRQDGGEIIACKLCWVECGDRSECARIFQLGPEHWSRGNDVHEGLHPAMPIALGLLLVEDCDAEPSHGLTRCLKCRFKARVNGCNGDCSGGWHGDRERGLIRLICRGESRRSRDFHATMREQREKSAIEKRVFLKANLP